MQVNRRKLVAISWMACSWLLALSPWALAKPNQPPSGVDRPNFVGSASCRECHERFHGLWSQSRHGTAMQPYTPDFAGAHLTKQKHEIKVGAQRYLAQIGTDQGWVVERSADGEKKLRIEHVLGGKNVYYFLTPSDRGRLQTLPVAYDVRKRTWFDTAGSGVRHFPGRSEEPLHWSAPEYTFNTSCYNCHVSQLATNYDLKEDTYRTTWREPGINCETCHAGADEHIRVCREAPEGQVPEDLEIIRTTQFDVEQMNALCATCHAKAVPLTTTFRPGDRFFDHFDFTTLEDPDFYPDGRDLGENYTLTSWRMSPCVKSGDLDCNHCHTSSGRFRFKDDPNSSCLPCHKKRVENVLDHSHHPAESAGNLCVSCHMPTTEFARMRRSDHSMRPPMPSATIAFKSPNACNLCHTDKDAKWADELVRKWRFRDYQASVLQWGALIDAARQGTWARLPEMLAYLKREDRDEVVANSLVRLLQSCPQDEKWPAIMTAMNDTSPLIRASAAEALGDRLTPDSVRALLVATTDDYRLVRVRAAAALASVPLRLFDERDRKHLQDATDEFLANISARPDDHASHYNLGNFRMNRGEHAQAIAAFNTSVKLRPRSIPPRVNASLVYNAMGQNERAEASLRDALRIAPDSVAANYNLGLLLAEMGRLGEAKGALRRAAQADVASAGAAYNLGLLLLQEGKHEGLEWLRQATALKPGASKFGYSFAFHLYQTGKVEDAISALDAMIARRAVTEDVYALLSEIHRREGNLAAAIEACKNAAADTAIPEQGRKRFADAIPILEQLPKKSFPAER